MGQYSKKSQRRLKEHFKLICIDSITRIKHTQLFEKIDYPENDFHVRPPHTLIDLGFI